MAQRWHWLRLRTTCHPTEDLDRVRAALQTASGLDDELFDSACEETRIEAHHGGTSVLMDVTLKRSREIRGCLDAILTPGARASLTPEIESRTDDHGVFHFRISKQQAFAGSLDLTKGDDAIQLRLKPEVHPASREAAMAAIEEKLQG